MCGKHFKAEGLPLLRACLRLQAHYPGPRPVHASVLGYSTAGVTKAWPVHMILPGPHHVTLNSPPHLFRSLPLACWC
jgi:hypothetical protein